MKRLACVIAILSCAASCLYADEDRTENQLLDAALRQAQPFSTASTPYKLESDFTILLAVPLQGHLIIKWQDHGHWWSKVEVAGFVETRIRNGQLKYTLRNQPATPARVNDVYTLLGPGWGISPFDLEKKNTQDNNGREELCLRAHRRQFSNWSEELCIDPTSHDLLSDASSTPQAPSQRRQFGNYVEFNGHRYPHQLDLLVNGTKVVSSTVKSIVSVDFDPALLIPPQGAIERRICTDADIRPPAILKRVEPDYGDQRDHSGVVSRVIVSASVLLDGSVTDAYVAERGADFMNGPALEAVKRYKFRPARCGNEPYVSDVLIEMKFVSDRRP